MKLQSSLKSKNNGHDSTTTTTATTITSKYNSLVKDVGIEGQLRQLGNLPKRPVSTNDVFCNRDLKVENLKAVGFDMDYTVVQYQQPAFDKLAFDGAIDKLVNVLGYPKEVLDFVYDHEFWVRGLIIDTKRGNFLKTDRHKYVRIAYHGLTPMSSNARKLLYSRTFNKVPSFSEKHFVSMDTLFQHVDAHIFASLIELKDKGEYEFLDAKTYEEMYREIRECVDLCHRDGVIKDEVARNPDKYIKLDEDFIPMVNNFRKSGIKVFLLTNSYWEYTSDAMNYLFHGIKVDAETRKKNEWIDLFDLVVVGSCKPAYLLDPYLNLYRVQPENGSLLNTDGVYEIEALGQNGATKFLSKGKVFQGGNWMHLQAMLETEAGEEILYVGDHLYADVLRSKRTLGWRTGLIVPELEREMHVFYENKETSKQITRLRQLRDEMGLFGDMLEKVTPRTPEIEQQISDTKHDDEVIKSSLANITEQYHKSFHPVWGQMFYAGYQDSRFAFYVQNYACIYMTKATNLGGVSGQRSLRTTAEMLSHDKLLVSQASEFEG